MALRYLRAPLSPYLLPRHPALGAGAPGARRFLRGHPHAVRHIHGWCRDHDWRRRADRVVQRRAGRVRRWDPGGADGEQRSTTMTTAAFLRYTIVIAAAGIEL